MDILIKAEQFVVQQFKDKLSLAFTYHNLDHTLRVVKSIKQIIDFEKINADNAELLLLAAWFHDIGYINCCEKHEEDGINICKNFLESQNYPQEKITEILSLINATAYKYEPKNKNEEYIRDADTSHLGSSDFFLITEELRKELKTLESRKLTKLDWAKENLIFLEENHQYYSDFAKSTWGPTKHLNILKTKELILDLSAKELADQEKALLNKKKLEKLETPGRGIETMFRVTLNNHTMLSQIADSKANILLSVNAIIISVALSTIVPKLDSPNNSHLVIPTFLMVAFSVATVILAIMSTRPKISSGTFTRKEIEERKINLLFFGNFHKVPQDEYMWAMKEMMKDSNYLYDSMIKDLYQLGIVLDRKYRILRTTYTVFTIGLLVSVIAFFISFKMLG